MVVAVVNSFSPSPISRYYPESDTFKVEACCFVKCPVLVGKVRNFLEKSAVNRFIDNSVISNVNTCRNKTHHCYISVKIKLCV